MARAHTVIVCSLQLAKNAMHSPTSFSHRTMNSVRYAYSRHARAQGIQSHTQNAYICYVSGHFLLRAEESTDDLWDTDKDRAFQLGN